MVLKRLEEQVSMSNSRHVSFDPLWELLPLPQAEEWEVGATTCTDLSGFKEKLPRPLVREEGPGLRTLQPLP